MTILLLGPSAWLPGHHPKVPRWVTEVLPPGPAPPPSQGATPRYIRYGLVARLRLMSVAATELELHHDRAGEDSASKLLRMVREVEIDKFAIYWPA